MQLNPILKVRPVSASLFVAKGGSSMNFSEMSYVASCLAICAYLAAVCLADRKWGRTPFLLAGLGASALIFVSAAAAYNPLLSAAFFILGNSLLGYGVGARLNDGNMNKLNAIWAGLPYLWLALLVVDPEEDTPSTRLETLRVKV